MSAVGTLFQIATQTPHTAPSAVGTAFQIATVGTAFQMASNDQAIIRLS